jgi:acyl-coenzyme A synthetase/AMP-(fatty) acid ligase
MTALSFEMLDRHVVAGHSERIACTDATGSLTFARLLERSAALAGGLVVLGIRPGDGVELDLPAGNERVIAVCALIRLGALPASGTEARISAVDGAWSVRVNDDEIELSLVERAGRSDPLPAGTVDEPGYADAVTDVFGDIVGPLLSGSPVV